MKIKYILLFCVTFVYHLVVSQTIKVGSIQVSNADLPGYYTIKQVQDYLALNTDWRLPTIEELNSIYENRSTIGGFKYGYDSYLASGNQNNYKFPNSQAEYGWAESWSLEFSNGRWVQPTYNTQLCVRLVKKSTPLSSISKPVKEKTKSKPARSKSSNSDVITTYSGAYGLTGVELDQPEIVFNLETTYPNSRFTQLYRWRYALGEFNGLIFEYNNRIYFGKNRDYDNSKWFIQGKVGYGMLKGRTYAPYTVSYYDPVNLTYGYNTTTLSDNRHFIIDFGLSLGYKFILSDRFTLDFGVGYSGYTKPKYEIESKTFRLDKWREGIGSPLEVLWSVGFFLD